MQTHEDWTHYGKPAFWDRLKERADSMVQTKQSAITAGHPGEEPLARSTSELLQRL